MLTLTDLICAAGLFAGAVCVVAAACVVQAWRWEKRYDARHDAGMEDDLEMRRRWDSARGGDR